MYSAICFPPFRDFYTPNGWSFIRSQEVEGNGENSGFSILIQCIFEDISSRSFGYCYYYCYDFYKHNIKTINLFLFFFRFYFCTLPSKIATLKPVALVPLSRYRKAIYNDINLCQLHSLIPAQGRSASGVGGSTSVHYLSNLRWVGGFSR